MAETIDDKQRSTVVDDGAVYEETMQFLKSNMKYLSEMDEVQKLNVVRQFAISVGDGKVKTKKRGTKEDAVLHSYVNWNFNTKAGNSKGKEVSVKGNITMTLPHGIDWEESKERLCKTFPNYTYENVETSTSTTTTTMADVEDNLGV